MKSSFKIDNIYYSINEDEKTVSIFSGFFDSKIDLVIPSSVTYEGLSYAVTKISAPGFSHNSDLISVVFPDSLIEIGDSAFEWCSDLVRVVIPDSMKFIGKSAFSYCRNLKSVTLPNSLTKVGDSAFAGCSKLNKVTIPDSFTEIGKSVFAGCGKLTRIVIPNSVTKICDGAFSGCNFSKVVIPNSVTEIGGFAFYDCRNLSSIKIPESVTYIGVGAFQDCTELTNIILPNSISEIDELTFSGCNKLASINIPDSVNYIGDSAFYKTPFFEDFPDGLVYIKNILYTYKGEMPENFKIEVKEDTISISSRAFELCNNLTDIRIPNSVIKIGRYAFKNCNGLTKIVIPNSLKVIETGVFQYCRGLTYAVIPNSVIEIGAFAFAGCHELQTVEIPNSVRRIECHAFSDCYVFRSFVIPNSVEYIGKQALQGALGMTLFFNAINCDIEDNSNNNGLLSATVVGKDVKHIPSYLFDLGYSEKKLIIHSNEPPKCDITEYKLNFKCIYVHKEAYKNYINDDLYCDFDLREFVPIQSITLDCKEIHLKLNQTVTLKEKIIPDDCTYREVFWRCDNPEVISFDQWGVVTGESKGEATIIVEALDGSGVFGSCKIFVD